MVGDTERREVARKLRKAIGLHEFAEVLGFSWTDDSDWVWNDVSNLVADLIEPSGHECVPGECPINVRHDNDRIDRDALLSLADDIDKQTDGSMFDAWLEDGHYIARRIREALGVKHG